MRDLEASHHVHDKPDILTPICWGAFGLFAGALAFRFLRAADEDRPPIIVRGGSLYFTSGTTSRPGRQWFYRKGAWEPIHPRGKNVMFLIVDLYPPDHSTGNPKSPTTYKATSLLIEQGTLDFPVKVRPDKVGRYAPAVSGPLQPASGAPNWTLKSQPTGSDKIDRVTLQTVEGKQVTYENPAEVWIWQC